MGTETMGDMITVEKLVSRQERLVQLAEECAELSKAALKLRRALGGGTPTPISPEKAEADFMEELSDVYTCIIALGYDHPKYAGKIDETVRQKFKRWAERLKAAEGE